MAYLLIILRVAVPAWVVACSRKIPCEDSCSSVAPLALAMVLIRRPSAL